MPNFREPYLNSSLSVRALATLCVLFATPVVAAETVAADRGAGLVFDINSPASASADLDKGSAASARGDYQTALRHFRGAAEMGFSAAQNQLGIMYSNGIGVEQDEAEASRWYRMAAEQGFAAGQFNLAGSYFFGWGVPQDYAEAAKWQRMAAEQGLAEAQVHLGRMYEDGLGVRKNNGEALRWYRRAAEQGSTDAQLAIGYIYLDRRGRKNAAEAARWLRLAAEQGHAEAKALLGFMYEGGRGLPQNDAEAMRWYRLAAEQGFAMAQGSLGRMYEVGRGEPKNDAEALRWYRLAAEQGDANSQYKLAGMYGSGRGTARNLVLAYKWLSLAAVQSNKSAQQELVFIERHMSREQIAEAQSLAAAFTPGTQAAITLEPGPPILSSPPKPTTLASTGTGFFVSDRGHVLTNHHVIDGCVEILLALPKGQSDARLLASNQDDDLAILHAEVNPSAVAVFRRTAAVLGEDILVAGYPLRALLSGINITAGSLSSTSGIRGDPRFVQITAPVQPGNSGGPLFDSAGLVVGVVVAKLNAIAVAQATGDIPQNVNFAIKSAVARSFLSIHDIEYLEAAAASDKKRAAIAEEAQNHTVMIECWK